MKAVRWTLCGVLVVVVGALLWLPARAADKEADSILVLQERIEKVADEVGKCVVSITIKGKGGVQVFGDDGGNFPWDLIPPELRRYFNQPLPEGGDEPEGTKPQNPQNPDERRVPRDLRRYFQTPQPRQGPGPEELVPRGVGSGIVISADGYILTNQHVVDEAEEIEVTLSDRRQLKAKVVGQDPRADLAVIKVEATGLTPAQLDGKVDVRRGMFVLAVGSPFGFGAEGQASVSFGIISGTRRTLGLGTEQDRYYGRLYQTDAAINPGNSGGPLCDLNGKVIGVNVAIASRTGGSQGVGFAIPIEESTLDVIERLKKGETIQYGFLGVGIRNPTTVESETAGAKPGVGAFVLKVEPDSPAEEARLQPADLIVAIDGREVKDADDVVSTIGRTPPGEKVKLTFYRSGKRLEAEAKVVRRDLGKVASGGRPRPPAGPGAPGFEWRGMSLRDLTPALRREAGLDDKAQGVYVDDVEDKSPAAKTGLRGGMVIDQVGGRKVKDLDEFKEAVKKLKGPVFVNVAGRGPEVVTE